MQMTSLVERVVVASKLVQTKYRRQERPRQRSIAPSKSKEMGFNFFHPQIETTEVRERALCYDQ
jgi:hypothetical protein